jgi:hypothetical protein
MEERRGQFECSYCGQKFNFRKDAEMHQQIAQKIVTSRTWVC